MTPNLAAEMLLVRRLVEQKIAVFEGLTDAPDRRERVRREIIDGGVRSVVVGRGKDEKPVTYEQAFQLTYGEPL